MVSVSHKFPSVSAANVAEGGHSNKTFKSARVSRGMAFRRAQTYVPTHNITSGWAGVQLPVGCGSSQNKTMCSLIIAKI